MWGKQLFPEYLNDSRLYVFSLELGLGDSLTLKYEFVLQKQARGQPEMTENVGISNLLNII